jgi:hypothetical protein
MSASDTPSTYPPNVQDAFDGLGPPREEFAGSPTNAYVAIVLGILGLIAGIGGTIFVIYYVIDRGFNDKVLRALPIPLVGLLGWYGLKTGLRNRFVRIYICEKGLVQRLANRLILFPFEDLTEIMQDYVKDGLDENGLPHMKRGTTFLIKRKDGGELGIDENVLRKPLTFARSLYKATRPYDIPWKFHHG